MSKTAQQMAPRSVAGVLKGWVAALFVFRFVESAVVSLVPLNSKEIRQCLGHA
jgi:hypothetical protein